MTATPIFHAKRKVSIIAIILFSQLSYAQKTAFINAQTLLLNIMEYKPVLENLEFLATLRISDLQNELYSDSLKKTFWIYVYNSAVQLSLTDSASRANEKEFFGKKVIKIAGVELSLYDIENGMLRKSRTSKFKMYKSKWFVSDFEKKFRVSIRDWRVFFALNRGVVDDPLIWFYMPETLGMELDQQVSRQVSKLQHNDTIIISPTFKKYLNDSGGLTALYYLANYKATSFPEISYKLIPGPLQIRKFPTAENL